MSLTIIPRSDWRPAARRNTPTRRRPSSIQELFIHWPGVKGQIIPEGGWTREQERAIMRELQRQHIQGNGWSDIGYSHVMFPSRGKRQPRIYTARGAQYVPASQLNHNEGTISIMVYMGTNDFLHDSTKSRLRSYVRWADKYARHKVKVRAHGEVVGTECPGPRLWVWVQTARVR